MRSISVGSRSQAAKQCGMICESYKSLIFHIAIDLSLYAPPPSVHSSIINSIGSGKLSGFFNKFNGRQPPVGMS